jgi:hypothetical protein
VAAASAARGSPLRPAAASATVVHPRYTCAWAGSGSVSASAPHAAVPNSRASGDASQAAHVVTAGRHRASRSGNRSSSAVSDNTVIWQLTSAHSPSNRGSPVWKSAGRVPACMSAASRSAVRSTTASSCRHHAAAVCSAAHPRPATAATAATVTHRAARSHPLTATTPSRIRGCDR